ncbi:hypothetical protein VJI93_09240, partial [Parvimonas sp. M20]|nr:hypothetical protein [Parvimonas sp. M20]
VLLLEKDISFAADAFDYLRDLRDIVTMFEKTEKDTVIEYKIMYENFTQGLFRLVSKASMDSVGDCEETDMCGVRRGAA